MSDGSSSGDGGGGDERSGPARSVLVRFVCKTQDPELEVPDTALEVPQHLARFGLSEVVNALLGITDPVPFDFLVNDVFLRTSLAQVCLAPPAAPPPGRDARKRRVPFFFFFFFFFFPPSFCALWSRFVKRLMHFHRRHFPLSLLFARARFGCST